MVENTGKIHLRIEEMLKEKEISKNQICKDLEIPRSNFNRYCRDEFQRIDVNLLCKLLAYFHCEPGDLIEHRKG
ncbi:MAG: helix-turn-helix domain-containing protein, partial [Blautia sp.]